MYSTLVLFGACIIGILLHNLVKIDEINKDPNRGNFSIKKYLAMEWASIMISCLVGAAAAFFKSEIKQLDAAGNWLGLGFVAIGYMAQSVLVKFMGKASKIIE
jgi:hypothetical protein